ncbi:hypothetical protein A3D80_01085 [Candidatus Roizmanbacteria bacterium RIFCSPHIGHO2_02_FULL_40_13b]|uniref:Glycosyltransferase 2-like domain-containing protein n=1 Tax=Candidatus Roizmanbacteria bacterium RIFCSPHIGHO2_01_FULL_39_24 TaxID=1802032 RepID=A0A1F7GMR6_9BACT|nr:MAG: hypothetical protein A2799_02740 [Candidatus Roizmanbacteria bacterium RIFCSPHIGHO2_01_FULL_39_24]OGK26290.1 MAG: hypothetical protein A3D80_01085 [Candidatus Roizmanbacteria bacterium RIFCSPHIGHO2_02_FULL_40_13b]OGK49353.1 MAG: hypothetical protein A3A56_03715 [Candidatus Roizmanbacteria bacterium RIFCSPLOWO2_01_FULL_40_32]
MNISIIIPVYKNKELLQKSFSHNYPFIKDCEIIIVNDYPEESIEDIFEKYSSVKLFTNEKNLGFAKTVNRGVKEASGDLLFLLNSDVFLQDDSFKKAVKLFTENKKLFAVSFAQIEQDKSIVGKNRVFFKNGFTMHEKAGDISFGPTGWAEGGTCIIRKSFFDELKGLNEIYSPFYWEDIDLSYRAKKKGYEVLFDPSIKVLHNHSSTIGKYMKEDFREIISYRNQFIFTWKNATTSQLFIHLLFLPKILIQSVFAGNSNLLKGFFRAALLVPKMV